MSTKHRLATILCMALIGASDAQADAQASDWQTPQSIVQAMYEVVSADAGEARDWERYRALFIEGAQLSVALDSKIGSGIMAMSAEDLIAQTDAAYATTGFHELPLVTRVEQHGLMASELSSFEVRLRRDDPAPMMRGLNHFQLLNDRERWWIVSNVGVMETARAPLPEEFQPTLEKEIKQ